MYKLAIEKLTDGMMLAKDVTRDDGVVLIKKGRQVNDDIRSLLSRLSVESVFVEGDLFDSDEERQEYLEAQEHALEVRFSRVEDDPVLRAVREMLRRNLRARLTPPPASPAQEEE